ncbi:hypothetical protein [Leptolyngbya sp. AN03gr2]
MLSTGTQEKVLLHEYFLRGYRLEATQLYKEYLQFVQLFCKCLPSGIDFQTATLDERNARNDRPLGVKPGWVTLMRPADLCIAR